LFALNEFQSSVFCRQKTTSPVRAFR